MIVLLMGVSGAGKTTLGERLARELGWRFIEADDYHPPQNVAKMAAGVPLQDSDRWPWLDRLNSELKTHENAVLACSALKQAYRERLLAGVGRFQVVHLKAPFDLIRRRLETRPHRYMPASLLQSQFETLEPPEQALAIDVSAPISESILKLRGLLELS